MARPAHFEHYRYLGDKRTQVVYDLDLYGVDPRVTAAVDRVLAAESFIAIPPQTLGVARLPREPRLDVLACPDELGVERVHVLRLRDGRDVDDVGPALHRDRLTHR